MLGACILYLSTLGECLFSPCLPVSGSYLTFYVSLCLCECIMAEGGSTQSTSTGFLQPPACSTCSHSHMGLNSTYAKHPKNTTPPLRLCLYMCRHVRYCLFESYQGIQQFDRFLSRTTGRTRFPLSLWNISTSTPWINTLFVVPRWYILTMMVRTSPLSRPWSWHFSFDVKRFDNF